MSWALVSSVVGVAAVVGGVVWFTAEQVARVSELESQVGEMSAQISQLSEALETTSSQIQTSGGMSAGFHPPDGSYLTVAKANDCPSNWRSMGAVLAYIVDDFKGNFRSEDIVLDSRKTLTDYDAVQLYLCLYRSAK